MDAPRADGPRGLTRRALVAVAALALVALFASVVTVMVNASRGPTHARGSHAGSLRATAQPTPTPPNTPTPPPTPSVEWVQISADRPADVLGAFEKSDMYQQIQRSAASGAGDSQYDLSRPEAPILVRALRVAGAAIFYDVWVIPFDTASGVIGYIAILDTDATRLAIHPDAVMQLGTARPHGQLARYSQSQAISMVEAQSHVILRPGSQPYLVYAPIDAALVESGQVVWNGGGWAGNPLWLVPCSDGQDRVVGIDGKVYLPSQIPVAKAS